MPRTSDEHLTAIEHVARSIAVCSCGWRGEPKMFIEWAAGDAWYHLEDPTAKAQLDPLVALISRQLGTPPNTASGGGA